jgi:TolB-like protein
MERKLSAILAADIVGYSAMMERDETATFERVRAERKELFEPEIDKRRGRVFKLMGDGLLAEFGSVVDAVECAVSLQRGLAERNASRPDHAPIQVRIGVNLGEVIVEGEDRYGEGVNIAARLEQLAEPGGIWVSGKVQREVEKKLAFVLEPMGEQKVKNIAEPISAYRVVVEKPAPPASSARLGNLPSKPALVVLPFANLGNDPNQEWFADGIVHDIITALSRFRSFAVVARNSSFVYKGRAVDVRQVAQELGVRYVLEGSVRRAGERLRITAQLVDGVTGSHLWAEHFDGRAEDIFDFQDRITEGVAMLAEDRIQAAEIERSRRERPESLAAYDIYLQAVWKIDRETDQDNADALRLLTRALAMEPDNPLLICHAVWALDFRIAMGWPRFGTDDRQTCIEWSHRGLQRADGDPLVMAICGLALIQSGRDYDLGMAALETAANANPNNLMVIHRAGIGHLHCGSMEKALAYFHRAISLSSNGPESHTTLAGIAHAHIVLGNYAEALTWAGRAFALNTTFHPTLWMLIATNAHLGRMEEARRFLGVFKALAPNVTLSSIEAGQAAKDPSRIAAVLEGLRIAGLDDN